MTPQEFKAWFDGFTEAFNGVPTKAQWARVKDRVAEIDGRPVTERVFVDRYWPTHHPWIGPYWTCAQGAGIGSTLVGATTLSAVGQNKVSDTFNSYSAMTALGHADAQLLAV